MSILLESLNQSQTEERKSIPSVDDSHFDDEMMSDEWLLAKVKFWRHTSFVLCVLLLTSLAALFFVMNSLPQQQSAASFSKDVGSENELGDTQAPTLVAEEKRVESNLATKTNDEPKKTNSAKASADELSHQQGVIKQVYKPTKKSIESNNQSQTSGIANQSKSDLSANESASQVSSNSTGTVNGADSGTATKESTEFEGLSNSEKSELPALEISSYAVSSNPNKSFVVLNGSFYGPGETIAPYLTLVSINKEGIVVKYKGRLISKKYSL